jgi:hypothetical protein
LPDRRWLRLEALSWRARSPAWIVPGTVVPRREGAGHAFQLDPVQVAFNIGAMIRSRFQRHVARRRMGIRRQPRWHPGNRRRLSRTASRPASRRRDEGRAIA